MTPRVILIDDDRDVREALGQSLDLAGYRVTLCKSFIEGTDHITRGLMGVIVTDVRMPGKDGFALLERALKIDPDLPVIILTGEGDIPMAVKAMECGAQRDFKGPRSRQPRHPDGHSRKAPDRSRLERPSGAGGGCGRGFGPAPKDTL